MKTPSTPLRYAIAFGVVIVSLLSLRVITVADAPPVPSSAQSAHSNAQINVSLLQLKRIGLGIEEYAVDNHHFPDAAQWVDEVLPYLIPKHLTPAERHQKVISLFHDLAAPAGQPWNYAYNAALSHLPLAKVRNPAGVVMAFESTKGVKNASDLGQSIPQPGWHHGLTCYLFADGHAKAFGSQGKALPFNPIAASRSLPSASMAASPTPPNTAQKPRLSLAAATAQRENLETLQDQHNALYQQYGQAHFMAKYLRSLAMKIRHDPHDPSVLQGLQHNLAYRQKDLDLLERHSPSPALQALRAAILAHFRAVTAAINALQSSQFKNKPQGQFRALLEQASAQTALAAQFQSKMIETDQQMHQLQKNQAQNEHHN